MFSTDCKRLSAEIFDQTMPLGRHWRLGLRPGGCHDGGGCDAAGASERASPPRPFFPPPQTSPVRPARTRRRRRRRCWGRCCRAPSCCPATPRRPPWPASPPPSWRPGWTTSWPRGSSSGAGGRSGARMAPRWHRGGTGGVGHADRPAGAPSAACREPSSCGRTSSWCGSWWAPSATGWPPRPGRPCSPSASSGRWTGPSSASCSSPAPRRAPGTPCAAAVSCVPALTPSSLPWGQGGQGGTLLNPFSPGK